MFDGKSQHFKQLSPGEFLKVAQDILACVYSYIPPQQQQQHQHRLKQRADPAVNFLLIKFSVKENLVIFFYTTLNLNPVTRVDVSHNWISCRTEHTHTHTHGAVFAAGVTWFRCKSDQTIGLSNNPRI